VIEAVVLDFGHTIVDWALSEHALLATYEEVHGLLVEYASGELPSAADLVENVSRRLGKQIEASYLNQELEELDILQLFQESFTGIDLHLPSELVRSIAAMEHRALSAEVHLSPENADALRQLRADGLRLGLVSNITLLGEYVREDLHRLGLLDLFDAIILSSEVGIRKPHPKIYTTVLDRLHASAERTVFVGDRLREDVGGPQQAGMRAVLTLEFRQEDVGPQTAQPDATIQRLVDLPSVIRKMHAEEEA